jgi:hypothetical protein
MWIAKVFSGFRSQHMRAKREKFDEIRKDPSRYYDVPQAIADDKTLTEDQKLELLESWAADEERLHVATEENMGGGESGRLDEVLAVLGRLRNPDFRSPSRH